jgi:hypothetical protein
MYAYATGDQARREVGYRRVMRYRYRRERWWCRHDLFNMFGEEWHARQRAAGEFGIDL